MLVMDLYQSKYMKAADLEGVPHIVTIRSTEVGEFINDGIKKQKLVVLFEEFEKGLALSFKNAGRIVDLYGQDDAAWPGQRITIFPSECNLDGETVDCILVKPNAPAARSVRMNRVTKRPAKRKPAKR